MEKQIVKKIIDGIGAETICNRLGVTSHSVRGARTNGAFPASWFDELDALCRSSDIECPRSVFNWRVASAEAAAQ
tara:strand:+ start:1517 stop:1741 length:225 start_codon:yes stop_codon:yes gene_type:complete